MSGEVKEYAQRAKTLRADGRLEESVLAARKATTLDPNDANAWWQLALSLRARGDSDEALSALAEVCDLAPDFAAGWYELGRAYYDIGAVDDSAQAYERALKADSGHIASMRMLAYALKGNKEPGKQARRLELLRIVFDKDTLDDEDTFDLAYLLGEAKETAEAAKVYESYTRNHRGQAAFYNLALDYRTLGRDLDAVDALEAALQSGFDSDNRKTVLAGLQKSLLALRAQVLARPQPFMPQAEWYQHYVNPYSLLNVEAYTVNGNVKALQRARQAVMREIELEDGKLDWLPGLVIDKSAAMSILAELDNDDAALAHQVVFENAPLNDFLMRGSLEHFLLSEDGSTDATLPHLLEPELLERIGPRFAAQYDHVLSRAAELGELKVVQCLLSGRRWVTPAQQDACFESTRRLLARLREPLEKLAEEASNRDVSRAEVERAFNHGSLGGLLALLPVEFYESHSAVGLALRALSVSIYNRQADAESAKAVLALGKACAQKSPALAHQLAADEKTLDGFIANEKKSEAHLTFKDLQASITKAGVSYGKHRLAPADIIGLRWGLVQTLARPPTFRFTVAFQARRGQDIVITWTTASDFEEQKKLWGSLVDATLTFILDAVTAAFQSQLESDQGAKVGTLEVRKAGVVLTTKGWFSEKQVLVPWSRLSSTVANGSVFLRDTTNQKASAELPLESAYNAFLLHRLVQMKGGERT